MLNGSISQMKTGGNLEYMMLGQNSMLFAIGDVIYNTKV